MTPRWTLPLALLALIAITAAAAIGITAARSGGPLPHSTPKPPPPTVINSPSCRPPPQHPDPVVLIHGTFALTSWQLIGPALAHRGYCVFTFDYGNYGTADIAHSAHQLAAFVDRLLALTHTHQVSIIGHSEGGMMPRYYIRYLGGAAHVGDLIALAPSNHGTTNPLALEGAVLGCTACAQQQAIGSPFLDRLNTGNQAPAPVAYTVLQTTDDEVVLPYTSAFLHGPANRVTNITLQNRCPSDASGHLGITTDPIALQWIENALARTGPANPAFHPHC
jgi:triacylglycerol lipase